MDHTMSDTQLNDLLRKLKQPSGGTRPAYDGPRRDARPGRDRLLDQIAARPAGTVLEVGCGSARNLQVLHEKAPQHTLFGLDPSLAMLATARDQLERTGCHDRITLAPGRPPELNPTKQLRTDRSFDVIFFSYVASRCPSWAEALEIASSHLSPDGCLYVLDTWGQSRLPPVLATLLDWTGLVHTDPHPTFLDRLRRLDGEGCVSCAITPIAQHSAYLATVTLRSSDAPRRRPPKRQEREESLPAQSPPAPPPETVATAAGSSPPPTRSR